MNTLFSAVVFIGALVVLLAVIYQVEKGKTRVFSYQTGNEFVTFFNCEDGECHTDGPLYLGEGGGVVPERLLGEQVAFSPEERDRLARGNLQLPPNSFSGLLFGAKARKMKRRRAEVQQQQKKEKPKAPPKKEEKPPPKKKK